jgi:RNA polymerase sigma factor (TIGR02999 family)
MTDRTQNLTEILNAVGAGSPGAETALLERVYDELRGMARRELQGDGQARTLEPTALVHEAWVRLFGAEPANFEHRRHFFGAAALAMRRILVERARKARRLRRGGGERPEPLREVEDAESKQWEEILALEDLLGELERLDARKHEVVLLRYYSGFSIEETATALSVAPATVKADWTFARAWLKSRLQGRTRE